MQREEPTKSGWAVVAVGALGLAWGRVWLAGLPFFTDDYDRWLAAAEGSSWAKALGDALNPWGANDATWGFTYRPVIVLFFKLFGQSGHSAALVFAAKAVVFAALLCLAFTTARRIGHSAAAALLIPALLCSSHGVFESMAWAGDLAVLSDLLILAAILAFARLLQSEHPSLWDRLLPVLLALGTIQTKGNGRLLAAVFLVGLLFEREAAARRRALLPTFVTALFCLPLGALWHGQPFPFGGKHAIAAGTTYTWHAASWGLLDRLLFGDPLAGLLEQHPLQPSIASALFPAGWAVAALLPLLLFRKSALLPADSWSRRMGLLLSSWAAVSLAALPFYPEINLFYQHRYVIDTLVPFSILAACAAPQLVRGLTPWLRIPIAVALAAITALHFAWGSATRLLDLRESFSSVSLVADTLNREMAQHRAAAIRAYTNSFIPYNYWPTLPGQERVLPQESQLANLPVGSYAYSWGLPLLPDYEVVAAEHGRSGAWIERWYKHPPILASLLRRAPPSPSRIQGRLQASAGNWAAAVPLLAQANAEHDTSFERLQWGRALLETGHAQKALAVLQPLEALGSDNGELKQALARARQQTGMAHL